MFSRRYFQTFTFHAVAVAAFGYELDAVQRDEIEFLAKSREAFEVGENKTTMLLFFLRLIGR